MSKVEEYELKQIEIPISRFLSHTLTQYDSDLLMKELKIHDKTIADVISYALNPNENKRQEIEQEMKEEYELILNDLKYLSPFNIDEQQTSNTNAIHNRQ